MGLVYGVVGLSFYLAFNRKNIHKSYILWSYLLIFYLCIALIEIVGFPSLSELRRIHLLGESLVTVDINLIPFRWGLDISAMLNIVFFIPLGVALPTMWPKFSEIRPTLFYGLAFSVFIEVSQLFTLHRLFDVNDILMNTAGVLIGWLCATHLFKWQVFAKNHAANKDWLIYLLLALFVCFIF